MKLVAEPLIPMALWLALAMAAVLVWLLYLRRPRVSGSRWWLIVGSMGVSLLLPLIVLLNLTWIEPAPPPPGKPVLNIVVDTSSSMNTADVEGKSRLEKARRIAEDFSAELHRNFEIETWDFDGTCRLANATDAGKNSESARATNIAQALLIAHREDTPQGQAIVLLSDGIHNVGGTASAVEAAQRMKTLNIPIYPLTLGGQTKLMNASIELRSPLEIAFVGQSVPVAVQVNTTGWGTDPLRVSLRKDDRELSSQDTSLDASGRAELEFAVNEPEPGLIRYEVQVAPLPGEASHDDNRATLLVRVVDRPIKMLLVEGKPYWDTKFLARNLVADRSIELTTVVRMSDHRYLKRAAIRNYPQDDRQANEATGDAVESSSVIRDVEEVLASLALSEIQIVLLGRNAEVFLTDRNLESLRNWIARDGGSLVCVRGIPSSQISQRLGQILPVAWTPGRESRFRVSLTGEGRDLRWLAGARESDQPLAAMPSLAAMAQPKTRPGLARVLAATGTESDSPIPVVSFLPYGTGRTVVVEGAGMWRWALLSPEHADREQVYGEVWSGLLRWLSSRAGLLPGQDVSLQADRVAFSTEDEATATLLVRGDYQHRIPQILLESSDNEPLQIEPTPMGEELGAYRVNFPKLGPGAYTARAVNGDSTLSTTAFDVRESWVESIELNARPELMGRLATESGGSQLAQGTAEEIEERFEEYQARSNTRPLRRITFWDRWWWLAVTFLVWSSTWSLRRKTGLI